MFTRKSYHGIQTAIKSFSRRLRGVQLRSCRVIHGDWLRSRRLPMTCLEFFLYSAHCVLNVLTACTIYFYDAVISQRLSERYSCKCSRPIYTAIMCVTWMRQRSSGGVAWNLIVLSRRSHFVSIAYNNYDNIHVNDLMVYVLMLLLVIWRKKRCKISVENFQKFWASAFCNSACLLSAGIEHGQINELFFC